MIKDYIMYLHTGQDMGGGDHHQTSAATMSDVMAHFATCDKLHPSHAHETPVEHNNLRVAIPKTADRSINPRQPRPKILSTTFNNSLAYHAKLCRDPQLNIRSAPDYSNHVTSSPNNEESSHGSWHGNPAL